MVNYKQKYGMDKLAQMVFEHFDARLGVKITHFQARNYNKLFKGLYKTGILSK